MSFIYAAKVKHQDNFGKEFETVQIFSATKTMLSNPKIHWSAEQRKNIEKYGFIKSMIPKCNHRIIYTQHRLSPDDSKDHKSSILCCR